MEFNDSLYYEYYKQAAHLLNDIFGKSNWVISSIGANGVIYNKFYNQSPILIFDVSKYHSQTFSFDININFISSIRIKKYLNIELNDIPDELIIDLPNSIKVFAIKRSFKIPFIKIDNINLMPPINIKNTIKHIIFNDKLLIMNDSIKLEEYYNSPKYNELYILNNIMTNIIEIIKKEYFVNNSKPSNDHMVDFNIESAANILMSLSKATH